MGRKRSSQEILAKPYESDLTLKRLALFVQAVEFVNKNEGKKWTNETLGSALQGPGKSTVNYDLRLIKNYFKNDLIILKNGEVTELGQRVYRWAKGVIEAHRAGRRLPIGGREQIIIGATGAVDTFILPGLIGKFLEGREGNVDFRIHLGSIETLLGELTLGHLDAALCGVPDSGAVGDLEPVDVWSNIRTVMIAAERTERLEGARNDSHRTDWRDHRTWLERRNNLRLAELAGEVVCVFEPDLKGVFAKLPRPARSGARILVERYASIISIVQSGAAVGLVPLLASSPSKSHYPGYQGLLYYHIAEADDVPPRKVCLWRTKEQVEREARQASVGRKG